MSRPIRPADFATPHSPWRALARRIGAGLMGLGLVLVVGLVGVGVLNGGLPLGKADSGSETPVKVEDQQTVLWAFTELGTGKALAITLFGVGKEAGTQVLFIPTHVYTLIPGIGTDQIGMASQYGGSELLVAAVENLMGIRIDAAITAPSGEMAAWFQSVGGMDVKVPNTLTSLPDAQGNHQEIKAGDQLMTGPELITYLGFYQEGESELDTFTRHESLWKAFGKLVAKDEVAKTLFGDQATGIGVLRDRQVIEPVLTSLHGSSVAYSILPVKPLGNTIDRSTHFASDWQALRTMVEAHWAGSLPEGATGVPRPIQILNGVGEPGIGQRVDAALAGLNVRVVSSENADTFTRQQTDVVVYSDDPKVRALGEAIVQQLGVGRLVKSNQPQSVVDVTIVVGADFLAAQAAAQQAEQQPAPQAPAATTQPPAEAGTLVPEATPAPIPSPEASGAADPSPSAAASA